MKNIHYTIGNSSFTQNFPCSRLKLMLPFMRCIIASTLLSPIPALLRSVLLSHTPLPISTLKFFRKSCFHNNRLLIVRIFIYIIRQIGKYSGQKCHINSNLYLLKAYSFCINLIIAFHKLSTHV